MTNLSSIEHSTILISSLDWGFGHTTRTSVIIKRLLNQKNQIIFAGTSDQINFIENEFPEIKTVIIEGYGVTLDSKKSTYTQLLSQATKIYSAIKKEKKWVRQFIQTTPVEFIISDNRYGFYHPSTHNIIVTHQISLQIPFGKKWINKLLKRRIEKFSTCWIPDWDQHQLSGSLSNGNLSIPTVFLGPLSRFKLTNINPFLFDYLFIISGPAPEKYNFARKVFKLIELEKLNACVALPYPLQKEINHIDTAHISETPSTQQLEKLINDSEVIVSKSGYTTLMDLIPFNKPMILLPTKGQYEQEYLDSLHKDKYTKGAFADIILKALS